MVVVVVLLLGAAGCGGCLLLLLVCGGGRRGCLDGHHHLPSCLSLSDALLPLVPCHPQSAMQDLDNLRPLTLAHSIGPPQSMKRGLDNMRTLTLPPSSPANPSRRYWTWTTCEP